MFLFLFLEVEPIVFELGFQSDSVVNFELYSFRDVF